MSKKRRAGEQLESPSKRTITNDHYTTTSILNILEEQLATASATITTTKETKRLFQDLDNIIVAAHELRANSYAKRGNTTEELKSILAIIDLLPRQHEKSKYYLRAGTLYSMQGYQERAIEIFQKGMMLAASNLPSSLSSFTDQYKLLEESKQIALSRSEKCIDFIANCPYDIVRNITDYLSTDNLYELTQVTRTWRQRIVEDPVRWKTFRITRGLRANKVDKTYRLLPMISRHIEILKINATAYFMPKCLLFIKMHNFSKLQSLKVSQARLGFTQQQVNCYEQFVNMLPNIAKTLTSLEFKNVSIELPPLAVILSLCRNLQVFHQHFTPVNQEWYTGLSLPYTTSLTKIILMPPSQYDEIPDHEIEALLCCSPALEHLVLDACDPDMVIPAVQLYCHKLTSLVLNRTHTAIQEDETSRFHKADGKLRYVFIGGDFLVSTLRSLLERSHQSLVALYLAPESPGFMGQEDWSSLESPVLDSLETLGILQCQRSSSAINDLATIMIRQGRQSIRNLKLFDFDSIIPYDILDVIMQVDYLERLTLDGCCIGDLADSGHNFTHLSHLSYLSLYMCLGVTSKFLESVSRITSLNELIINCIDQDVETVEKMNEFTRHVGELPCLTYLQLAYVSLDCVDIQNLCKSKTLKKIEWNSINVPDDAHKILHDHGIKLIY